MYHLRNADRMIAQLIEGLERLGRPAVLAFYGDHVPTMPSLADPFSDPRTDYFVMALRDGAWLTGPRRDLDLPQLADVVLAALVPAARSRGRCVRRGGRREWGREISAMTMVSDIVLRAMAPGMLGHAGYEHFASPLGRSPWPLASTVFHDQHHGHFRYNYAHNFSVWDRVMGTLHPRHDGTLEKFESRPRSQAEAPVKD
jgi:hypothetical protein